MDSRLSTTLSILALAIYWGGCSSTEKLTSNPRPNDGAVDGYSTEWEGKWKAFQNEGMYVAAQNDGENVFLCLQVRDRALGRGMIMSGLTVWFDHRGGVREKWGIRFPVGLGSPEDWRRTVVQPRDNSEDPQDRSIPPDELQESVRELELMGPGDKDVTRVSTVTSEREYGIKVAMRDSEGPLLYELKVPRSSQLSPFAIGDISDNVLGIEIETSTVQMAGPGGRRPAGRGEGPPTGGGPPGGMRPGQGGEGRDPESMGKGPSGEKISISLELHLI